MSDVVRADRMRGGFSLVEIAIATLILALGVLPMIGVFIANSEETRANKNRSFAAALASSALERYRKFRPETLAAKFATEINPETIETSKTLPETDKDIDADPILTPKDADIKDADSKEFFRIAKNFRRVAYFKKINDRMGQLTCTVFRKEVTAGRERVLVHSLASLLTDPIFPTGKDEGPPP